MEWMEWMEKVRIVVDWIEEAGQQEEERRREEERGEFTGYEACGSELVRVPTNSVSAWQH